MNKMIYVVVDSIINADAFDVYVGFDLDKARQRALGEWRHLTEGERKKHNLYIDGYSVDVDARDNRSAEEIYRDLLDIWDESVQQSVISEAFTAPYSVPELIDIARALESDGITPVDIDADDLNRYARADRGELTQEDRVFILDQLAKFTDYRSEPRRTNDSPIAAARLAAGMTQAQLAAAVGVEAQHISRWEQGARKPKLEALQRIAEALNVDVMSLVQK